MNTKKRKRRVVVTNTQGAYGATKAKSLAQLAREHTQMLADRRTLLHALPSETRSALNHLAREHGGTVEDHGDNYQYDPTADAMDWVDDDDVGISADGGERDDAVRAAHEHFILPSIISATPHLQNRRNRLRNLYRNWNDQVPALAVAYLQWKHNMISTPESNDISEMRVLAIDAYEFKVQPVQQYDGELANVALIRCGLLGTAPIHPSIAINLRTLDLYHRLRRRHPRLSIQAFARAICDMQDVNYRTAFREQISDAFDAYLEILRTVDAQVDDVLGRGSSNWRVQNSCVCCNYTLENEPELSPAKLVAMDGNNSAKRIKNAGREDERVFNSTYFLTREKVDEFKDEVKHRSRAHLRTVEGSDSDSDEDAPWLPDGKPDSTTEENEYDHSKCTERWKASAAEHHKRALDIYDATGMFASACRHGFILIACEMVQSGELAKYPLAVSNHIIDNCGDDVGTGLDNGCSLKATIKKSALLGPKALEHRFRLSVNSFHGYAHSRTCQLDNHPLYLTGWGIEDLEGMERVFSASNAVASTIRYATRYHYHQALDLHFKQWDDDKYFELSNFIFNNYKQCLNIIAENEAELEKMKSTLNINDDDFERWIKEEREFLHSLKQEPEERVLEIAYVQALETRARASDKWNSLCGSFLNVSGSAPYSSDASATRRIEARRNAAMEELLVAIRAVGELEAKLAPERSWAPQDQQYQDTLQYIRRREFHRALDRVEQLVVQRLFELSKANIAGMGYKMRTSIWKALKKRGKAIRNALRRYNTLAQQLHPPAPVLEWKDIVNYTFVSEFDVLRHSYSRSDITSRPWALQKNRELTGRYFKMLRAREEIKRLNVEVQRLYTSLDDEESLFRKTAQRVHAGSEDTPGDAALAAELHAVLKSRLRVHALHRERINNIWNLPGYQGSRERGTRVGAQAPDLLVETSDVVVDHDRPPDLLQEFHTITTSDIDEEPTELDDRTKDTLVSLGEFMENLAVEDEAEGDREQRSNKQGVPLSMLSTFRL